MDEHICSIDNRWQQHPKLNNWPTSVAVDEPWKPEDEGEAYRYIIFILFPTTIITISSGSTSMGSKRNFSLAAAFNDWEPIGK
jgi:hypothetical protein